MKRVLTAVCALIMLMLPVSARTEERGQIVYAGGGETADGITVSKTVKATERENCFLITLSISVKEEEGRETALWYAEDVFEEGTELIEVRDAENENTVVYQNRLRWEPQKAGAQRLEYTVRLFGAPRVTALGEAQLKYQLSDEDGVMIKSIRFPKPTAEVYAGNAVIEMVPEKGDKPITGGAYRAVHDEDCAECGGSVAIEDVYANSREGRLTLRGLPSGHTYILKEDAAPEGYETAGHMKISVSMGETTVTDNDGNPIEKLCVEAIAPAFPEVFPKAGEGNVWIVAGGLAAAIVLGMLAAWATVRNAAKQ